MDRVLCVILCIVVMVVAVCILAYCGQPAVEAVAEPTTAETTEETMEVIAEPTGTEMPTTAVTEPPVVLYDVPLDDELQLHIIHICEEKHIDPAIVVAMAFTESTYDTDAVGDGGNSYGLLQVQPRWHYERMQRLGCTDLLDPYQNVIVGVDYLAELMDRYGSIDKALTAYNRGSYSGTVTDYAKSILAKAEEIK